MSQVEIDFSMGNKAPGYRIKRFELYNWGTYHNGVYKIVPDCNSYYITGGNGCGKSTLLDGFTTLIADVTKLTYNEAAGSRPGERDLRSYVEGNVRPQSGDVDDYSSVMKKCLRPWNDKKWYTVLLAQFHNQIFENDITLAIVLWLSAPTGQPNRFYVYSDKPLSIAEDFSNFGSNIMDLKKKLLSKDCTLFDTYSKYRVRFTSAFGISPKNVEQALGLFVKTVSMKKVEKLSKFIRESVLKEIPFEDSNGNPLTWENIASNAAEHYMVLKDNYARVKDAEKQIKLLKDLPELDAQYQKASEDINKSYVLIDTLPKWYSKNYCDLAKAEIDKIQNVNVLLESKKDKKKCERNSVISAGELLKSAYDNAGGGQIEFINEKIKYKTEELNRKQKNYQEYNNFVRSLALSICDNEDAFAQNRTALRTLYNCNKDRIHNLEEEKTQDKINQTTYEIELKTLENEIKIMENQRSNIDTGLIEIREVLCTKLGIPSEELPFAGELMEIKPEEGKWEHAIESVLVGLAKTMLVPDKYYEKVKNWLNDIENHKMCNNLRVSRLDFNMVPCGIKLQPQRNIPNVISNKLVFEVDSPMYCWLRNTLNQQRYAYICCEDSNSDEFRAAEKAITPSGLRKEGNGRHIVIFKKDTYKKLLGRDNKIHVNELKCKCDDLYRRISNIKIEIRKIEQTINNLTTQNHSINDMEIRYDSFDDINYIKSTKELDDLLHSLNVLKNKSSDTLQALELKITENKNKLDTLDNDIDLLIGEISANDALIKNYKSELARQTTSEINDELKMLFHEIDMRWNDKLDSLKSINNLAEGHQRIVHDIDNEKKKAESKLNELTRQIEKIERKYSDEYKAETDAAECVPSIEYRQKYLARYTDLIENDLPECLEDLRQRKDELSQWDLMSFAGRQNTACKDIENTIRIINEALSKITYSVVDGVEHYIELKAIKTKNQKIREFQDLLKRCIENANVDSGLWSEEKYEAIAEIIRRFTTHDKDTFEAIDVRNYYEFEAHEKRRDTGEKVDWYKDSDGRSGGEKEKLAYTILAACLSYQFGLNDSNSKNHAMRFVLIDEAFRNHADDSAQFALDLFREIGMQLIIVTPGCSKSYIIEDYIGGVGYLVKSGECHTNIRNMSVKTYRRERLAGKIAVPEDNKAVA